jgi:uncharacterized membrane protein YhiD involved in acid resistance
LILEFVFKKSKEWNSESVNENNIKTVNLLLRQIFGFIDIGIVIGFNFYFNALVGMVYVFIVYTMHKFNGLKSYNIIKIKIFLYP